MALMSVNSANNGLCLLPLWKGLTVRQKAAPYLARIDHFLTTNWPPTVIFIAGGQFLSLTHCFILLVIGVAEQCRTDKKSQCIIKLRAVSQFSDPEGQRFESSRSHQEQHLMGCCSFCFAWILWSSKRADSNSPCPALCIPRGRNAPVGRFWGAAWRIPSGAPKGCGKNVVVAFLFVISLKTATYVARFSRRRILKTKKRCVQRAHLFGINKYPQLVVKHLQVS